MYTAAALSFGLIQACLGGLVLYSIVLSDAGEWQELRHIWKITILSQNGQNDLENQSQWLLFSIPNESIPGCMFGAQLVIPDKSVMSYCTDKANFLEF